MVGLVAALVSCTVVAVASAGSPPGTSDNWAGYAAVGPAFTSVSGSWVQPAAQCFRRPTSTTSAAFWVGLGGTISFPSGLEMRTRSVPSAGGLYPLELYASLHSVSEVPDGLYHYNVLDHALERLRAPLDPHMLAEAVIPAPFLVNANVLVFISAVFDRTLGKYGARGYRYILLEAGHAAQNLCLVAAERGLASLCVGGFMDARLNGLLELDPRLEATVYCVGLGHAAEEHAPG